MHELRAPSSRQERHPIASMSRVSGCRMMTPVKSMLFACVAALLLFFGEAAAAQTLGTSLKGLLDFARQNNPEFAAMRAEAVAAAQRIQPAGAFPDPLFRVELQDIMNGQVGSTKYTVMQPLPFFGKRELKRQSAEADAAAAGARADAGWTEVAAKIKTGYAQYVLVTRNEMLTNEIIEILVRLEAVAQARYAGGLVPQQDALRALVERTSMQAEVIALRAEKRQLKARLNTLLAREADAPLADPADFAPLPAETVLRRPALEARIRDSSPSLVAERARVLAAERNRDVTYRNRYPDFAVGVAPIQTGSRISAWEVMMEVNIPLQQTTRRSQEAEANAMLTAAHERQRAAENQLLQELSENLAALEAAREIERLNSGSLQPQAELTLRSASASYENGRLDFTTLLDAQRQIRAARLNALKAAADARIRLSEIERLIGEDL